jgi:hypothetical protein
VYTFCIQTFVSKAFFVSNVNTTSDHWKQRELSEDKTEFVHVRLSKQDKEALENFLDKFSSGEDFSEQFRTFCHWLKTLPEGITDKALLERKRETDKAKDKARFSTR